MKKIIVLLLLLLTIMLFVSCNSEPFETFAILYTDGTNVYSTYVIKERNYRITNIPEKPYCKFSGYYDSQQGGTQFTDDQGCSISPFRDNNDLLLYAQFTPLKYKLVLNYEGAEITGETEKLVTYGEKLSGLPTDLSYPNKIFKGWYTQSDCAGVNVFNKYGAIPGQCYVTENVFALPSDDTLGEINIYAGFEGLPCNVTLYYNDCIMEEIELPRGSSLTNYVSDIKVNNMVVSKWSKEQPGNPNSKVFDGIIEDDIVLYAKEYSQYIEFDSIGGSELKPRIVSYGETVSLPYPEKKGYKFAGWISSNGKYYGNSLTMPNESLSLIAMWNPVIRFVTTHDQNVSIISQPVGTKLSLPIPNEQNYQFAGWYTAGGLPFTSAVMPAESMILYAKYYEKKYENFRFEGLNISVTNNEIEENARVDIPLLGLPTGQSVKISVDVLCSTGEKSSLSLINNILVVCYDSFKNEVTSFYLKEYTDRFHNEYKLSCPSSISLYYSGRNIGSEYPKITAINIDITCPDIRRTI